MACGMTLEGRSQTPTPLSLDEAITSGLTHHPLVAASEASLEKARAGVLKDRAARWPTISAAEDTTYSNDPVFVFGSKLRQGRFNASDFDLPSLNHPAAMANFSASTTATWVVFDAGSAHRDVESAQSTLHAAELSEKYTREELGTEITKLYYRVLLAEDQVGVAEANLVRAEELSSDIQDRERSGLSLESDNMRTMLAQRSAEDDLAAARDNLALARRDLFDSIGEPDSSRALVRPPDPSLAEVPLKTIPGALESRFDLQALREQESALRLSRVAARATGWPRLSTYAHAENDAQHFITNGSGNWTIAAKLEIPIFDGGLRKAHEQETNAQLHSLHAQEAVIRLAARSEVASLRHQIGDLSRRYVTAQDAVQVEAEALQTARDRYDSGLATIGDVLNDESNVSAAELNRAKIFYQLRIANADLAFVCGLYSTAKAGQP